jgi:hypothetical protein
MKKKTFTQFTLLSNPFSNFTFLQAPRMSEAAVDNIPPGNMLYSGAADSQLKGYAGEAPSNRFAMKLAYEIYAHRNANDARGTDNQFYERLFTQKDEGLKSEVEDLILKQEYPQGLSLDELKGIVLKCDCIPTFEVTEMASGSTHDMFTVTGFQSAPQACLDHIIGQIDQRAKAEQEAPQMVSAALIGNFSAQPVPVAEAVSEAGLQYPRTEYKQTAKQLLEGLSKKQKMQYTSGGGCLTSPDQRGLLVLTLLSAFKGVNVAEPNTWQTNKDHVVLIDRLLNGTMSVEDQKNLPETINTYQRVEEFLKTHRVDSSIENKDHFKFTLTQGTTSQHALSDSWSFIQRSFGKVPEVQGTPLQSDGNTGHDVSASSQYKT